MQTCMYVFKIRVRRAAASIETAVNGTFIQLLQRGEKLLPPTTRTAEREGRAT